MITLPNDQELHYLARTLAEALILAYVANCADLTFPEQAVVRLYNAILFLLQVSQAGSQSI